MPRPRKDGNLDEVLRLRIHTEDKLKLQALAAENMRSMSQEAYRAILHYLENNRAQETPAKYGKKKK